MVAWDAWIEAARAAPGATELLVAPADVRLVLADPVKGEDGHGAEPGADAAAWLARPGVQVSVERLPSEGHTGAEVLRRFATDFGADMLVVGDYGHSRIRARIFGGVSKSMPDESPLPLFMAR